MPVPVTTQSRATRVAVATRARRQAAGKYPTAAHKLAFWKLMQRGGFQMLTKEDMLTLSSHPHLTVGQRQKWSEAAARAK